MRPEIYISTAKVADKVLSLARTSPHEHVTPPPLNRFPVPGDDRIGADSDGFRMILQVLNPERILIAAEVVGIGRTALRSHRLRQRAPGVRPHDPQFHRREGTRPAVIQLRLPMDTREKFVKKMARKHSGNGEEIRAVLNVCGKAALTIAVIDCCGSSVRKRQKWRPTRKP